MISIREVKITHTFQKVEHSRLGIKIAKVICCMYNVVEIKFTLILPISKFVCSMKSFPAKNFKIFYILLNTNLEIVMSVLLFMVFVKANNRTIFFFLFNFTKKINENGIVFWIVLTIDDFSIYVIPWIKIFFAGTVLLFM